MSSSYDISTVYDALDDSLVSNVIDLDSWTSSFSPSVTSDEPIHHATPRPRQSAQSPPTNPCRYAVPRLNRHCRQPRIINPSSRLYVRPARRSQ